MKALFIAVLLGLTVCQSRAQTIAAPPSNAPTNRLTVWLDLRWNTNHAVFHAPATIDLQAYVGLQPRPHAGDVVQVEFFEGTRRIGLGKAVWHDAIRPQEIPGHAVPMHIVAAQFHPAEWVWKNVPAGAYTLTARATWKNGVTAVSKPFKATVLP